MKRKVKSKKEELPDENKGKISSDVFNNLLKASLNTPPPKKKK